MLVRAVTKAWQDNLDGPPSIGRVYQPKATSQISENSSMGWCRADRDDTVHHVANDDCDDDPEIQPAKRDDIVPKRRGAAQEATPPERLRTSYEFWMGIVVGAGAVLVIKTVLAVQAPFGVTWY